MNRQHECILRYAKWCDKQLFEEKQRSVSAPEILAGLFGEFPFTQVQIADVADKLRDVKRVIEKRYHRVGQVYLVTKTFFDRFRSREVRNMDQAKLCMTRGRKSAYGICRIKEGGDLIWQAVWDAQNGRSAGQKKSTEARLLRPAMLGLISGDEARSLLTEGRKKLELDPVLRQYEQTLFPEEESPSSAE